MMYCEQSIFVDYKCHKAKTTIRRQVADLALFAQFLDLSKGEVSTGDLSSDPVAWAGVTWGLVERFREWMLGEGYAVGSVNVRLSTIRVYGKLAMKAGAITEPAYRMIQSVEGYHHTEGKNVDETRETTRRTHANGQTVKKAQPVVFSSVQAKALCDQPTDTPRGRRDKLLMTILLEHGLRVSEAAILQVSHFDLAAGVMRFYRPKTDKTETHELTKATLKAAKLYFKHDAPAIGAIFLASQSRGKSGTLNGSPMSISAIRQRVKVLGQRAGIEGLSPHDLRHYCATRYYKTGCEFETLMHIFGWTSLIGAKQYVKNLTLCVPQDKIVRLPIIQT